MDAAERGPLLPRRVLVWEWATGGGWATLPLGDCSWIREGAAMRDAVACDLAGLPDTFAVPWIDARLPHAAPSIGPRSNRVESKHRAGPMDVAEFANLCRSFDDVVVIAPETDDLLAQWLAAAGAANNAPHGRFSSLAAVRLCADKLRLASLWERHRLRTPPTRDVDWGNEPGSESFPLVVKPRDGAGSVETHRVNSVHDWRIFGARCPCSQMIWQPWIAGRPISVGAILGSPSTKNDVTLLPIAEQHLSDDGRFQYGGGAIPARLTDRQATLVREAVRTALEPIPGLRSYVGCDLILPDDGSDPVMMEINPRFTTSYIGYRALCEDNLARWWFETEAPIEAPRWKSNVVTFQADGRVQ